MQEKLEKIPLLSKSTQKDYYSNRIQTKELMWSNQFQIPQFQTSRRAFHENKVFPNLLITANKVSKVQYVQGK